MEASTTTVNIVAEAPKAEEPTRFSNDRVIHNHKPNFGRYIAGCRKCQENHPDGPPPRPLRSAKAPAAPAQIGGLTREDVIALLREPAPATTAAPVAESAIGATSDPRADTLERLVELMLAREKKTLEKDASDEARKTAAREDMVRVAQEQEALTANMQANCGWEYGRPGSHTKENGKTAINGQVHNDGLYHPICFRCFKAFPPIPPRGEQVSRAVSA